MQHAHELLAPHSPERIIYALLRTSMAIPIPVTNCGTLFFIQ